MSTYINYMEAIINQLYSYADLKFDDPINVIDEDDVDDLVKGVAVGINFMGEELQDKVKEIQENQKIILKALEEKELLLREIHHRVKNNVQVMIAVLNFQLAEEVTKTTLLENIERLKAMAEIQELIYGSDDFLNMDFSTYCMKLCSTLSKIFARGQDVIIEYDMESSVFIDFERARHVGSFVSEAIMNSFKHQFPWPVQGLIKVSLKATPQSYVIEIKDNGLNKPSIEVRENALGKKLMGAFSKQLRGTCEINSENGYSIKLTFPKGIQKR